VAGLAQPLADKLAAVGLIPKRQAATGTRLGGFLDNYIKGRTDAEEGTREAMRSGAARLVAYFGAGRDLGSITPEDADDCARRLLQEHAEATAARTVKWARQFLQVAVRKRLIPENPFVDVKARGTSNDARKFFVTRATAGRVLDACPDAEWRPLVALSRYGGLRCRGTSGPDVARRRLGAVPLPGHEPQDEAAPGQGRALGTDLPRAAALP
jgi:hypothetical protein